MTKKRIYSIIESRTHPYLTPFYTQLGLEEVRFNQMRKLISTVKKGVMPESGV